MSPDLRFHIAISIILGVAATVCLVRFFAHRTFSRFLVFLCLAVFCFGVLRTTTAELSSYCSRSRPHIDCVPDQFDGDAKMARRVFLSAWPEATIAATAGLAALAVAWRQHNHK